MNGNEARAFLKFDSEFTGIRNRSIELAKNISSDFYPSP